MIIAKTIYRCDDIELQITPFDITSTAEYQEKYRGHLFCNVHGCDAEIELAHRDTFPYFRTRRNSKHAAGCPYAFENDPSKTSSQAAEVQAVMVSSQHKRNSLNYANKKRKQAEGTLPLPKRVSPTANALHPRIVRDGIRLVPTLNPALSVAGIVTREPHIPTRKPDDITLSDIGHTINVFGRVSHATITDNSVRFFLNTSGNMPVSILFYNRFRDNSQQQYGWISLIARYIKGGIISDLPIACIGICEAKSNRYEIQVMDEDSISINDTTLSAYIRDSHIA